MKRKNFKKGSPRKGNFSKNKRDIKPATKSNIADIDAEKQNAATRDSLITAVVNRRT